MFSLACLGILISYLTLVRILRYRRLDAIHSKYSSKTHHGLDPPTAQKILQASQLYDHPFIMMVSEVVALFKIYGIPSIASLLLKTGQLKSAETVSRRITDTGTLVCTWITNPIVMPYDKEDGSAPQDPRHAIATARVNYLHGKYHISNDDFLYNLSLFVLEPIKWTARFDWRPHSEIEQEAIFVFWCEIGRRMGIKGIWSSYQDMKEWSSIYENEYMVPSQTCHEIADTSLNYLLERFPARLRPGIKKILICFLDKRTRRAMMFPEPEPWLEDIVYKSFYLRAFFVRHLCLPRYEPSLYVTLDDPPPNHWVHPNAKLPRMKSVYRRRPHPWYYPKSTGVARLWEMAQVFMGLIKTQNLPGNKWKSEGYRLEELGPVQFEKDGHAEVMKAAAKMQGCSVTGPWSLDGGGKGDGI